MGGASAVSQLDVYTAQAVRLSYRIADLGSRAAAVLLDILIQVAAGLIVTLLVMAASRSLGGTIAVALVVALNFAMFFGYYIVLEAIGAGQTLGKRAVGIRVVASDGSHAGWGRSVLRNLMRVIDWLPGFYGVGIVSLLTTREHRRLGDFVAGTVVVHVERAERDEGPAGVRPDPACTLTAGELETALPRLQNPMLRCQELLGRRRALLKDAFLRIAAQIRHEFEEILGPVQATDDVRFLEHVLYLQQEISLPSDALEAVKEISPTAEELRKIRLAAMRGDRHARQERARLLASLRPRGRGAAIDDATLWQALAHVAMQDVRRD